MMQMLAKIFNRTLTGQIALNIRKQMSTWHAFALLLRNFEIFWPSLITNHILYILISTVSYLHDDTGWKLFWVRIYNHWFLLPQSVFTSHSNHSLVPVLVFTFKATRSAVFWNRFYQSEFYQLHICSTIMTASISRGLNITLVSPLHLNSSQHRTQHTQNQFTPTTGRHIPTMIPNDAEILHKSDTCTQ